MDIRERDKVISEAIKSLADGGDPEKEHRSADKILCDLLEELGFCDTVRAFDELVKWY